jgi:hypothetical protein
LEESAHGQEARKGGVQGSTLEGSTRGTIGDEVLERGSAGKENLSLIGKVTEERSLGQPRAFRNFCDRGVVETLLQI